MKKIALLAALAMLASLFSFSAFAESTTIDQDSEPKTSTLTVNATKDVAYTLSIPSGTASVDITSSSAQKIGEIGLTAANFTSGSIDVAVTSGDDGFALVNGGVSVAYELSAAGMSENKFSFDKEDVSATLTDVNLTITNPDAATIAGTYTDTLTFTATASVT